MTQVTIPVNLGGDGLPFSDDGSSARDMQGQGYASNFFPMVKQTINAAQTAVTAAGAVSNTSTNTTSTTSHTISTGSKVFTVQTGKAIVPGMYYIMASTSSVSNYVSGQVTTYDSVTGQLTLNVVETSGVGTFTAWTGSVTAIAAKAYNIGDIIYSMTPPVDSTWLPCTGNIYLKASYPALAAKLGSIFNNYLGNGTTVSTLPESKSPTALKWLNGQFVYLTSTTTDSSQVYTSPDGDIWTARTSAQTNSWQDVIYDTVSGYYVAVSQTGTNRVMRSTDAITWVTASASEAVTWVSLDSNPAGTIIACASSGINRVMRSTNGGSTWTGVNIGTTNPFGKVIWNGSAFYVFGSITYVTSADGFTWSSGVSYALPFPGFRQDSVVWTGKYFIAVSNLRGLIYSTDATNWSPLAPNVIQSVIGSGIVYLHYAYGNLIISHPATSAATGINFTFSNDLSTWYSGFLYISTVDFVANRFALSPSGTLVGATYAASNYAFRKSVAYNTSTQFVVPVNGPNYYIKALTS